MKPLAHKVVLFHNKDFASGCVHHEDLSPEHQQQRQHLPGHPPLPVVARAHRVQGEVKWSCIVSPWKLCGFNHPSNAGSPYCTSLPARCCSPSVPYCATQTQTTRSCRRSPGCTRLTRPSTRSCPKNGRGSTPCRQSICRLPHPFVYHTSPVYPFSLLTSETKIIVNLESEIQR